MEKLQKKNAQRGGAAGGQKRAKVLAKQPRKPFACISNGGYVEPFLLDAVDRKKNPEKENPVQIEESKVLDLECLNLVGREHVPSFKNPFAEWNCYAADDIKCAFEYGADIWRHLCQLETSLPLPNPRYIRRQPDVTSEMRSVLIDWLVVVGEEYKIAEQAIHLSVNYIDRFLSEMAVVREKLQLVGAAAMMLATKVEEVNALEPEEWRYLTGQQYTIDQIKRMELLVLKILHFDMNPPTSVAFIKQLCMMHCLDKQTLYMAMYLSELVLLEGGDYLCDLPSKTAVACVVLARYILRKENPYYDRLKDFSGYSMDQLKPLIKKQHVTYRESPTKAQQAIQNKYQGMKYQRVGTLTPQPLNFDF